MNELNEIGKHGYWEENFNFSVDYFKCFYNNNELIGYEEATVDDNVEIKKYYLR